MTRRLPTLLVLAGTAMVALMVLLVVGTAAERTDAQAVAGGSVASVPKLAWRLPSEFERKWREQRKASRA
jgi:hypothetical protein